jgi:transposase-like protein
MALEAIRERKTMSQIASEHDVHASQVTLWKKQALESIVESFNGKNKKIRVDPNKISEEQLYCQIGQLKVELDWLKKKSGVL